MGYTDSFGRYKSRHNGWGKGRVKKPDYRKLDAEIARLDHALKNICDTCQCYPCRCRRDDEK